MWEANRRQFEKADGRRKIYRRAGRVMPPEEIDRC
jgi:hypothetical protein